MVLLSLFMGTAHGFDTTGLNGASATLSITLGADDTFNCSVLGAGRTANAYLGPTDSVATESASVIFGDFGPFPDAQLRGMFDPASPDIWQVGSDVRVFCSTSSAGNWQMDANGTDPNAHTIGIATGHASDDLPVSGFQDITDTTVTVLTSQPSGQPNDLTFLTEVTAGGSIDIQTDIVLTFLPG